MSVINSAARGLRCIPAAKRGCTKRTPHFQMKDKTFAVSKQRFLTQIFIIFSIGNDAAFFAFAQGGLNARYDTMHNKNA